MMRRLRIVLAFAAAVVGAPLQGQSVAKHMLYRVRGPSGATVYLLGSVHLLTPEAGKLPAVVDSAFAHAKTIAFETSLDSVQQRASEMIGIARLPAGSTLRTVLSPAAATTTDSLLHLYGLSLDQLAGFKPWFVSVLMTQLAVQKGGFKADYGVDMQLDKRAREAGKTIVGLEGVDFQLHLMDAFSPAAQEHMLVMGKGPEESLAQLVALKDAWIVGDAARLDSLMNADGDMTPEMLETMVNKRNRSWIPQIEQMLAGPADALVVVGAAHLVGKNGVVQLLRAKGYTVEQL